MSERKPPLFTNCPYCAGSMAGRRADAKHCGSPDCRNAHQRATYAIRLTDRVCVRCGKQFRGTDNSQNCGCDFSKNWDVVLQERRCRNCDALMEPVEVRHTNAATIRRVDLCEACKSLSSEKRAVSKRGPLNPNWKGGCADTRTTEEKQQAVATARQRTADRMRQNNPMKNPAIRAQVSQTRLASEKKYTTGPDHHLWRGNREPAFVLRTAIQPWVRQVMRRDKFRCVRCGAKRPLEVHHAGRTFADIIKEALEIVGCVALEQLDVSGEMFARIREYVVSAHTLELGITYCRSCHALVDPQRRVR